MSLLSASANYTKIEARAKRAILAFAAGERIGGRLAAGTRQPDPCLEKPPPLSMNKDIPFARRGISLCRKGGYPLCAKRDIPFARRGISLLTERGYPFWRKEDIPFALEGDWPDPRGGLALPVERLPLNTYALPQLSACGKSLVYDMIALSKLVPRFSARRVSGARRD